MNQVPILPQILGTIPGWITAGGVVTILGIVLKHHLGLRRLKIEADQVEVTGRGIRNADEADIRDHYAEEVRQLRERLDRQAERHRLTITDVEDRARQIVSDIEERSRKAIEESDRRHEECEQARREMRREVDDLREEIRGLRAILAQRSESVIRLFPNVSPEIEDAAARAADAVTANDASDKPRKGAREPKQ